jgi:uncharacterized membrane protein SirB2
MDYKAASISIFTAIGVVLIITFSIGVDVGDCDWIVFSILCLVGILYGLLYLRERQNKKKAGA